MKLILQTLLVTLVAVLITGGFAFADEQPTREQTDFFESKIRPVLVRECYGCHSTSVGQIKGGLWLDTREGTREGGDSGPAVVPGDLESSLLWNAINHEDFSMPPKKKLPAAVLADFRTWIEMGAPDPRETKPSQVKSAITPADIEAGRKFWSFQPPQPQVVPASDSTWPKSDIDHFILARLKEQKLEPAADADSYTMLRRLTTDVIGLPPSPEQIERFQSDWNYDPDAAMQRMADALLAMPQFGERWGRHWLDVVRYAESTGKEINFTFPHAWRYRDYVIDSFNDDKPYHRFVQEQLAGDLLPVKTDQQFADNLVATGFLTFGPKTLTEQNSRQFQLDLVDEQIDVTTRVMLGVSVACARCHDHKFDPIPQTDYYALAGIFGSMTTHYGTIDTLQNRRPSNLIELPVDDLSPFEKPISPQQLSKLKQQLNDARGEYQESLRQRRQMRLNPSGQKAPSLRDVVNVAQLSARVGMLEAVLNSYDESGNPLSFCMAVQESNRPADVRLLERGEFNRPAQTVPRGFPQVLCENPPKISRNDSGRLEFARWVGSEQNPLTARVMVNRVWQHLLGQGIVRTPEDFASTGMPPTHPELLDHLSVEFMKNDWSVKRLVRSIVLSRVYRSGSEFNAVHFEIDPENQFLWRMTPKRMDAEVIRDSMLAISGQIDLNRPRASIVAAGGNGFVRDGSMISSNPAVTDADRGPMMGMIRNRMQNGGDNLTRPGITTFDQMLSYRSVYLPIVRDNVARSLAVFDFAESTMVVGQRESSNTPDQGLYFLNNAFVIAQADAMAKRLMREATRPSDQFQRAFLLAYGRPATSSELRAAGEFYRDFNTNASSRRTEDQNFQKLSALCQAIMASAEFRFVN